MHLPFDQAVRRRVYLMRHGDVAYFDADGRRVADSRLVVLTDRGRGEALAMRDRLQGVAFDRAISTGLPRTNETCAIVLGGRNLAMEIEPRLEEIRGGDPQARAQLSPIDYAYAMFKGASPDAVYANGERIHDFYSRVTTAFEEILRDLTWSTLLLAAHGGVNRAILCSVTRGGPATFGAFEQDTGCLNVIDIDHDPATGRVLRQIIRGVNITPEDPCKTTRQFTTMEGLALRAFPHLAR